MTTPAAAEVDAAIAAAASALELHCPSVTPLQGGVANRSFRMEQGHGVFVVKLSGPASAALGASVRTELAMHALAAGAGLAPAVVHADEKAGLLVTQHAAGRVPTVEEMRSPAFLRRVGGWIARLHGLAPPAGIAAVDLGERAAGYLESAAARGDARAAELLPELARRRAALPPPAQLTACHHDLHHRNFIDEGSRLLAVDWEYAGPGDPAADLAGCIGYHALEEQAADALFDGYGGADGGLRARVAALGWIFDCLWLGWNSAAALAGLATDPSERSSLESRLTR